MPTSALLAAAALALLGIALAARRLALRNRHRREGLSRAQAPEAPRRPEFKQQLDALERGDDIGALRVEGDLVVTRASTLPHPVLVRGALRVEPDATLEGAAVVEGDTVIGSGAKVTRPLIVRGDLRLEAGARIPAARVGGDVFLGPGARFEGSVECNVLHLEEGRADEKFARVDAARPVELHRTSEDDALSESEKALRTALQELERQT